MAGTLTISTLSDGTNSTSSTNCIQGSAKAWVNFNGSPSTVRASYNVSSVTRVGTGNYTVNFTNALSDANYVVTTATDQQNAGSVNGKTLCVNQATPPTTSNVTVVRTVAGNTSTEDSTYNYVAVFR